MPVMNEQVRMARAERLIQLRFEEGMSPSAAWLEVKRDSKAKAANPAELCRREIRRYRANHSPVDVPGDSHVVLEGDEAGALTSTSLAGKASVEVTGNAAVKPSKRCKGVEDRPCGKKIPARRMRCDDCRVLKKSVDNRNYYRANKWSLWAKRMKAKVEAWNRGRASGRRETGGGRGRATERGSAKETGQESPGSG